MTKKLKKVQDLTKNIEWPSVLMSLIFTGLGIFLINHLSFTYPVTELSILLGLIAILKGFFNFYTYSVVTEISKEQHWQWSFIVSASISILTGLLLIFNFSGNGLVFYLLGGAWMIFDTIPHILAVMDYCTKHSNTYKMLLTAYGLSILMGIGLIFNNIYPLIETTIYLSSFFLINGVILIWDIYSVNKKQRAM